MPALIILGLTMLIALSSSQPTDARSSSPRPAAQPDGEFVPALNSSATTQQKTGTLMIGERLDTTSGCSVVDTTSYIPKNSSNCNTLCLNWDGLYGHATFSASNLDGACITSWEEIRSYIGGPFVQLSDKTDINFPPYSEGAYAHQAGYVSIKNNTATTTGPTGLPIDANAITTYVVAPQTCAPFPSSPTIKGCIVDNKPVPTCRNDSDCQKPGYSGYRCNTFTEICEQVCTQSSQCYGGVGEAIRATNGKCTLCSNNTAATFNGTVAIWNTDKSAQLRLNSTSGITKWTKYKTASFSYLQLQSMNGTLTPQTGGIKITGVGFLPGGAIAGVPPACAGTGCPTCGDGMCSTGETADICPIDCFNIPFGSWPLNSLEVVASTDITVSVTPSVTVPPMQFHILVVKSTDKAKVVGFTPLNGHAYQVGEAAGQATVFMASGLTDSKVTQVDTTVPTGVTMWYRAFEANSNYRYMSDSIAMFGTSGGGSGGGMRIEVK